MAKTKVAKFRVPANPPVVNDNRIYLTREEFDKLEEIRDSIEGFKDIMSSHLGSEIYGEHIGHILRPMANELWDLVGEIDERRKENAG
jgi:hypothetical protein